MLVSRLCSRTTKFPHTHTPQAQVWVQVQVQVQAHQVRDTLAAELSPGTIAKPAQTCGVATVCVCVCFCLEQTAVCTSFILCFFFDYFVLFRRASIWCLIPLFIPTTHTQYAHTHTNAWIRYHTPCGLFMPSACYYRLCSGSAPSPLPKTRERRELACTCHCFRNSLVFFGPRYVCWRRHAHALSNAHFNLHLFISYPLTSDIFVACSPAARSPNSLHSCDSCNSLIATPKQHIFPTRVDPT